MGENPLPFTGWKFQDVIFSVEELLRRVQKYAEKNNMEYTLRALVLMQQYHDGSYRKGEGNIPYIIHPLTMAYQAIAFGIADDVLLPICLLHDVIEDTSATKEDLEMPEPVTQAVLLLTYDKSMASTPKEAKKKYYEQISHNQLASIVKLLDRCNNISTMAAAFSRAKLVDYINETETYVLSLLDMVEQQYEEYCSVTFLLRYHMMSILESLKRVV